MEEFKDFSRPLSDFPVLFKADLTFQESPLNSSTFQACENHVQARLCKIQGLFKDLKGLSNSFQELFTLKIH